MESIDNSIIGNVANSCLSTNRDTDKEVFADIANQAVDCGVTLDMIAKSLLVKLSTCQEFKLRKEAKKMVGNKLILEE